MGVWVVCSVQGRAELLSRERSMVKHTFVCCLGFFKVIFILHLAWYKPRGNLLEAVAVGRKMFPQTRWCKEGTRIKLDREAIT